MQMDARAHETQLPEKLPEDLKGFVESGAAEGRPSVRLL
jgi:hypothetical protein